MTPKEKLQEIVEARKAMINAHLNTKCICSSFTLQYEGSCQCGAKNAAKIAQSHFFDLIDRINDTTYTMSPKEAVKELSKRFPNQTVNAVITCWYAPQREQNSYNNYAMYYGFTNYSCSSVEGNSFEDCFSQIDQVQMDVDTEIAQRAILFRKFNLNLTC